MIALGVDYYEMYKIIEIYYSIRVYIKYLEIIAVYFEMRTPLGQQRGDRIHQCLSLIFASYSISTINFVDLTSQQIIFISPLIKRYWGMEYLS